MFVLMALTALVGASASAEAGVDDRLRRARDARAQALAEARWAEARLADLQERYATVEAEALEAAAYLVDALIRERELRGLVVEAQAMVDARANAAYRAGPGAVLGALLEADSLGALSDTQVLIERAFLDDLDRANDALQAVRTAAEARRALEDAQARLVAQERRLARLLTQMQIALASAREAAHRAGITVESLERRERQIKAEREENEKRIELITGLDQSELLALLGPTGGRGCRIPPGLDRTGESFSGEASFYGEEFAGQSTAMGAIFDPALFTAAHRTLPLPSFLHVTYQGRCATVLVNDRGPYIEDRVLDLSEGAATYLGMAHAGVGQVTAEILVPK
jgi:rare lipoprotein A (peptidoglycan hydrolase)